MGRLTETICVRLTKDEYEFIEMISNKTGLPPSEAMRLALNMFRVILGLEAIDVEKVGRALRQAAEKAVEDARREGWLEELIEEERMMKSILGGSKKSSKRRG